MRTNSVRDVVEREPFRPFIVRLSNGRSYEFHQVRDLGVAKDFHAIVHFGENGSVTIIDTESITEITEGPKRA
jgi:hypothetical protein